MSKYIINYEKKLGSGSFADVFLGIRSEDGLQCAFKCSRKSILSESKIMEDLQHDNIIKFYESLEYFDNFDMVIVMEYCNQGSLFEFTVLHQGLCDNMFLKVLECLNHGMFYLREKTLIHRDIKLGNIMVHQDSMGDFHVKLGDLGTAKKVPDGVKFETLCGTPEYLHPDLYINYIEGIGSEYKASSDLWSMGVTLYHAAITELPFKACKTCPFIESITVIKDMHLNKKPGIISGHQNSEDPNDITWSDKLPSSCRLSPMLRDLASTLIGNLMDRSDDNTYGRFFIEATNLSHKKRVVIFNSLQGQLQILYLNSLTYNSIMDCITALSGIPKEDLTLLTTDKRLLSSSDGNIECCRSLPVRGHLTHKLSSDTVFIVTKKPDQVTPLFTNTEAYKVVHGPPATSYREVEHAKKYSQSILKLLYKVSHAANYIDCQMECFLATAKSFDTFLLEDNCQLLNEALPWQAHAIATTCQMTESLLKFAKETTNDIQCSPDLLNILRTCTHDIDQLRIIASSNKRDVIGADNVQSKKLLIDLENRFYSDTVSDVKNNLDFLVHIGEELVNEMRMLPLDKMREADFYKLQVWRRHIELYECYKISKKIYEGKCAQLIEIQSLFVNWLKVAKSELNEIVSLRESLYSQEELRLSVRTKFLQIIDFLQQRFPQMDLTTRIPYIPTLELAENGSVGSKIYEIRELTHRMMTGQRKCPEM